MNDLQARLAAAVANAGVTGASLAIWDGEQLHTASVGVRNSVTGDPVTADTLMHVGSITKIFNTTLVMQLVDDGLIQLDDPVLRHLPELRTADMAALQRVTCRMLLNHTSGINGNVVPDHGPDQERIEDLIPRCAGMDQLFEPGGGPSYGNTAVVIAGYLAQKLRGASWYTLVKDRILTPLGLNHALVDLSDIPLFRVSVGDLTDPATGRLVQTTRPFLPLSYAPAGATMMMSAADLVGFGRAHLNGGVGANGTRILSDASARLMQQPTVTSLEPASMRWGLGWQIDPRGLLLHGGGGPGVLSMFFLDPMHGRALALLTNCDQGGKLLESMVQPLMAQWTGAPTPVAAVRPTVELVHLAPYLGTYGTNIDRVEVLDLGGRIGVRIWTQANLYDSTPTAPGPAMPMRAVGDHTFMLDMPPPVALTARFLDPDASGRCPAVASSHLVYKRLS